MSFSMSRKKLMGCTVKREQLPEKHDIPSHNTLELRKIYNKYHNCKDLTVDELDFLFKNDIDCYEKIKKALLSDTNRLKKIQIAAIEGVKGDLREIIRQGEYIKDLPENEAVSPPIKEIISRLKLESTSENTEYISQLMKGITKEQVVMLLEEVVSELKESIGSKCEIEINEKQKNTIYQTLVYAYKSGSIDIVNSNTTSSGFDQHI